MDTSSIVNMSSNDLLNGRAVNLEDQKSLSSSQFPEGDPQSKSLASTTVQRLSASEYTQSRLILVSIMPSQTRFTIHKALIMHDIPVLAVKLGISAYGLWHPEKANISLRDISIEGFKAVVDWVYDRKLPTFVTAKHGKKSQVESYKHFDVVYETAEKLGMKKMQDELMQNQHESFLANWKGTVPL